MATNGNGDEREIDTATLRVALVVYKLDRGWTPTTRQVAELCNISREGAWMLLCRMSDVVPVGQDEDGQWFMQTEGVRSPKRHYVVSEG